MNKYLKNATASIFLLCLLPMLVFTGEKKIRSFHADFGFALNKQQLESTIKVALAREKEAVSATEKLLGDSAKSGISAAICPHDDYSYTAQVYLHVMPYIKAKRVIILGVAHKAKDFSLKDKLIFGDFDEWDTAAGGLKVSDLEKYFKEHMKKEDFIVSNDFMVQEHSIEALTNWLKIYNPDSEIIPICVPHMKWDRMQELAKAFSAILAEKIKAESWEAGKDYAVLISNDSSHYGDQGWGGKNNAPFGCSVKGYLEAKERDIKLTRDYLSGPLNIEKIQKLYSSLVDVKDPYIYLMTWCGRFSIPFGLSVMNYISESGGCKSLTGDFLSYGTSVALGLLDEGIEPPLQTTAPSNFHHWVGYVAVAFR
jgi:AmmeMemoRadiSam system protein B